MDICRALAPTILAFSKRVSLGGPTWIFASLFGSISVSLELPPKIFTQRQKWENVFSYKWQSSNPPNLLHTNSGIGDLSLSVEEEDAGRGAVSEGGFKIARLLSIVS